jgi:hypothetical protein
MAALFTEQQRQWQGQEQLNTEPPSSSYIEAIEATELDLIQHVKTSGVRKQVNIYTSRYHILNFPPLQCVFSA